MTSVCPRQAPPERRPQRRSRLGCRNCKLRKLKCDEGKPQCSRCCSFGVVCTFLSLSTPDLQPVAAGLTVGACEPSVVVRGRSSKTSPRPPVASGVWTSDGVTSYELDARCQDFITRYLGRSLLTPDDPSVKQVNGKLLELAFAYPFLMHASLAIAFAYDRHLNTSSAYSRRNVEECHHWSRATSLLSKRLREQRPIAAQDKDPIWGTAAALAVLTFSSPDACTPEESWPMRRCPDSLDNDSDDLDWLRMSEGKMSLWHIVNPLRPDSLFVVFAGTYALMHSPLPLIGTSGIPAPLAALCGLTDASTAESSPYFDAAHGLAQILDLPDSLVTTGVTQLFTRSIQGAFKDLLRRRDPVALLLLYLWYRKTGRNIWWIDLRARVECPSICLYLRLHHPEDAAVQAFLPGGVFAELWG